MNSWDLRDLVPTEMERETVQCEVKEVKLLSLLIALSGDQYRRRCGHFKKGKMSFMVWTYEAMRQYVLDMYHDGNGLDLTKQMESLSMSGDKLASNELNSMSSQELDDETLKEFRHCLIRSLLRSLIHRVKAIEFRTSMG